MARKTETVRVTVEYTITYLTEKSRTDALVALHKCPFGIVGGSWSAQRGEVLSVVPASDA